MYVMSNDVGLMTDTTLVVAWLGLGRKALPCQGIGVTEFGKERWSCVITAFACIGSFFE